MSDEELLEKIRLGMGYLLAHDRLQQCDDIREVVARWAKAKADLAAARAELDDANETIEALTAENDDLGAHNDQVIAERDTARAEDVAGHLGREGEQGAGLPGWLARIAAIMREESAEFAEADGDLEYWRQRAAEHFRRYAGWIEAGATGTTAKD